MSSMPSSFKSGALAVTLLVGAILAVLVIAEGAARLMDKVAPLPARTWQEHRLTIPPPYQNAPYDIAELVAEAQQVKWRTADTFGWLPEDHNGRYINIENALRLTTDTPASPRHTVWIFGGSTVMGAEVPDEFTLPSYLQRELNTRTGGRYRVVNLGATTITTKHQVWRLNNSDILPGDIVVFFDGVNDIIQSLYYKNQSGTMVRENQKAIQEKDFASRAILWFSTKYSEKSSFVRRYLNPFSPNRRPVSLPNDIVDTLRTEYGENIWLADKISTKKKAKFVHFLQPSLFSVSTTTKYEKQLLANGWLYPLELGDVYAIGYPALRRSSDEAAKRGIASHDLTHVFDLRSAEVFLDFCHVNHYGNELLALAILPYLPLD